jgi:hypothetical protein
MNKINALNAGYINMLGRSLLLKQLIKELDSKPSTTENNQRGVALRYILHKHTEHYLQPLLNSGKFTGSSNEFIHRLIEETQSALKDKDCSYVVEREEQTIADSIDRVKEIVKPILKFVTVTTKANDVHIQGKAVLSLEVVSSILFRLVQSDTAINEFAIKRVGGSKWPTFGIVFNKDSILPVETSGGKHWLKERTFFRCTQVYREVCGDLLEVVSENKVNVCRLDRVAKDEVELLHIMLSTF